MTQTQRIEIEEKYRHLGFTQGRNSVLDNLTQAALSTTNESVRDYLVTFIELNNERKN